MPHVYGACDAQVCDDQVCDDQVCDDQVCDDHVYDDHVYALSYDLYVFYEFSYDYLSFPIKTPPKCNIKGYQGFLFKTFGKVLLIRFLGVIVKIFIYGKFIKEIMYEIIVGRLDTDRKKYGLKGTILIGKQYVTMGQTSSLSNPIYMDLVRSHAIFICGKRGGGKSYTMGVIAEGLATLDPEVGQNISIILLDTMGIYWTMKYPNYKDEDLLKEWGLKPKGLNVQIYTPAGYYDDFKSKGIPTDFPFSIDPSELTPEDWALTFDIEITSPIGAIVERAIMDIKDKKKKYSINDMISIIKKMDADVNVKNAAINRFMATQAWGVFSEKATPLKDIAKGGQVTVMDVSCYATGPGGWKVKSLVIGLIAKKLFIERMVARRMEELEDLKSTESYFTEEIKKKSEAPMVWLVIDEAHEFLPREGKTAASDALVTILREGRQPGLSLIVATQQPGKIHTDVMTQSDILLSHRLTSKLDTDALGMLMQSYLREGIDKLLNNLPRVKGSALILDDSNERMSPMRVRPRLTWHGGEAPTAIRQKRKPVA